jgi:cobalt transporter subunit CbtA
VPLTRSAGGVNLGAFNRIVRAAAFSGILAGLLLTAVQQVQVSKIILQAETFEDAAAASAAAPAAPAAVQHVHADGHAHTHEANLPSAPAHTHEASTPAAAEHAHEHTHGGWQPENGRERTFFTAVANISMAVGFGLLLAGAISLRGPVNGQTNGIGAGLLWGGAGYLVFFLAPSIGLPPEVPGTVGAPLAARQMWWLTTVSATAGGLALLVFARGLPLKLLGAAVLFVPHLVGAPQPEVHASSAPAELTRAFIYATALANAAFWLALGGLAGFYYKKSA